jgi:predicted transcriptional regulator
MKIDNSAVYRQKNDIKSAKIDLRCPPDLKSKVRETAQKSKSTMSAVMVQSFKDYWKSIEVPKI